MAEFFLVCGLGYLGQHCVASLKKFGVRVIAIEKNPSIEWELKDSSVDELIIGDCSYPDVLLSQVPIEQCRAALIVTTSEKVNIETAIALRRLNPHTRLIIRSERENFNELLSNQLGNLIAYEPKHLPANAYALAALGKDTIGFLELEGVKMSINRLEMSPNHQWKSYKSLEELNNRNRRLITSYQNIEEINNDFYHWNPEAKIKENDTLIYVSVEDNLSLTKNISKYATDNRGWKKYIPNIQQIKKGFINFWRVSSKQQMQRVALLSGILVVLLLVTGTILYKNYHPDTTILSSFFVTSILLLGGFSDLFDSFEPIEDVLVSLQIFSLTLTVFGTALIAVLYALLTEALLSAKFQFNSKRPPLPKENHTIIIGFGKLGQKIAEKLQELKQPVLAITFNSNIDTSTALNIPLIWGNNMQDSLELAHTDKAKSMIIVTDDDIVNIEVALISQKINPHCHLVIRTNGDTLTENLTELLPQATIIDPYAVVAEAFSGAAFGENVLHLFRLQQQTLLLTQYDIDKQDTLINLLLAEVAYGYGVIPIMYTSGKDLRPIALPSDDIRLSEGDSLVVLATTEGLKSIEQGNRKMPEWEMEILAVKSEIGLFEGANAITRVSGCSLKTARETMANLPQILPIKLYQHQAVKLKQILSKNQVTSRLISPL